MAARGSLRVLLHHPAFQGDGRRQLVLQGGAPGMNVPVIPGQRVGRFPTALGQQLKIAGYDLVEGLHLVHHADAPGQAAVVKAAGKGEPAKAGNRPAAPALLR